MGSQQVRFWLEWDCGTMNVRDLSIKFTSYRQYIASQEWTREHSHLPYVVCVAPDIAQQRRMQRVAQVTLAPVLGLVVWTTTEQMLAQYGSLAPIWLQGLARLSQALQEHEVYRHSRTRMLCCKQEERSTVLEKRG
jgi:hypothetical protein